MQLLEIFQPIDDPFRTEKDDQTALKQDDTRKTRLTLGQLNRLRMMNDTRKLEHEQKLEKVADQYKAPAEPAAGL